tara:strand:+ start:446 stop:925 length:480 start_codon:yes stop_codon:yes gene_type:complete
MSDNLIRNYAEANNLDNNPHTNFAQTILENDVAIDQNQLTESMNEMMLEEFKENVKAWTLADNQVKRLNAASKQLKTKKKELNEKILDFMARFNIEDLNTKEGIIRYKKTFVKEPLTQKMIKEKLNELFKDSDTHLEKINEIFTNRNKIEKTSLRRLKI